FTFGVGSSVGGLCALGDVPRRYTATVHGGFVALAIDRELFLDRLEDDHDLARDFLTSMAAGLIALLERTAARDGGAVTSGPARGA
ncbi:MAG: hypothetical protein D6689_06300, partial [Deltaproteobacteria bacterium]